MNPLKKLNNLSKNFYLTFNIAHGFEDQVPEYKNAKWYDLFWLLVPMVGFLIFCLTIQDRYSNKGDKK